MMALFIDLTVSELDSESSASDCKIVMSESPVQLVKNERPVQVKSERPALVKSQLSPTSSSHQDVQLVTDTRFDDRDGMEEPLTVTHDWTDSDAHSLSSDDDAVEDLTEDESLSDPR